ncbi:MAG: sulfite exporter TauE/SafE family protein [Flavobacteriaceae bacterium]|jgi:cytochrome c biogenesis protein CcdA|nr:sulfite exporter TauE/SafE family protein [Flavobacteriaceae bacterium]
MANRIFGERLKKIGKINRFVHKIFKKQKQYLWRKYFMLGFFITLYTGLSHAFEADHLLAVSNLVTNRNKPIHAVKDGVFWGIGHTSTIFFVAVLMIILKYNITARVFSYFEAAVGLMLILLGIWRLIKLNSDKKHQKEIIADSGAHFHHHKAALGVGMVHGLAGSGALVVGVLMQMRNWQEGFWYILIFGIGSIVGMFLAAGLFSIPFSKSLMKSEKLQIILILVSSLLCIFYGSHVIWENLSGM